MIRRLMVELSSSLGMSFQRYCSTLAIERDPTASNCDEHAAFRELVAASRLQDWRPTFENLSAATGVLVDDLVHHALVRWVSGGSEALLSVEPQVLRSLLAARDREDWAAVAGMLDWLRSGG